MSLPAMKAFSWQYFKTPITNIGYYDIVNKYETNPLEVIRSKIIIRLGTIKGEWIYDIDFGLPITAIKNNASNPDVIAQLIADEILKIENVSGVSLINYTVDNNLRNFTGNFSISTIYGTINFEVNI